ncbi:rRNA maturation RNase YbeY [Candidatus Parcubacteria bacterium]|nr:MAG: rRNA maturation RNase YbeY [Candidatus Parcubacteria bacterium]
MPKLKIDFLNYTRHKISKALVKRIAEKFWQDFRIKANSLSVVIVGDQRMRRLNGLCFGQRRNTDVLAFEGEDKFLGEIILCYPQIKRQASRYKNSARQEFVFVLVHGLLHLIGYQDGTEEKRKTMHQLGANFIKKHQLK